VAIEIIGKLIDYLSKIISSLLKLFPWVADKYSVWREGGGPGVGSPDEDIPNGSKQPQDFIECAGALWKPYINLDKEGVISLISCTRKLDLFVRHVKEK